MKKLQINHEKLYEIIEQKILRKNSQKIHVKHCQKSHEKLYEIFF